MPKFLERKLKAEYPGNDRAVYGTLNQIGAMRGSHVTAKGREMDLKHHQDMTAPGKKSSAGHPHKNLGKYLHKAKAR